VAKRRREKGRHEFWREFIAGAAVSDEPIRSYCERHGVRANQYYWWRKRLATDTTTLASVKAIPFALVTGLPPVSAEPMLELVLDDASRQGQWRLRIGTGVDEATLSTVLAVLRR
jgi:transposase-like protein